MLYIFSDYKYLWNKLAMLQQSLYVQGLSEVVTEQLVLNPATINSTSKCVFYRLSIQFKC